MSYDFIQDEGTTLPTQSKLNFIGDSVVAADGASRTDVTVSAVKLQSSSPGTPQTGHFNIDSGVGRLAVQDKEGQVFNVRAYGAVLDGTTDDTAALDAALTAAAAVPRGVVLIPQGILKTTGNHDLSGRNGIAIVGVTIGQVNGTDKSGTVIRLAHATNDLFKYGTGGSPTHLTDIHFADFAVTSDTVTRTGGWVLRGYAAPTAAAGSLRRARFERIDVKKQVNGFWFNQYEFVWMNNIMMSNFVGSGGIGIKAGQTTTGGQRQGAGLRLHTVEIYGNDFVGSDAKVLGTGIVLEDIEGAEISNVGIGAAATNCLKVIANSGNTVQNLFFDHYASDTCKGGHGTYLTGSGEIDRVEFSDCWFAGAGRDPDTGAIVTTSANGLRIDCVANDLEFKGSRFLNNAATGLYVSLTGVSGNVIILGNTFRGNGSGAQANNNDGIYLNIATGASAIIVGNSDVGGSAGVSLRTGTGANLLKLGPNHFQNGVSFGVVPDIFLRYQGMAWRAYSDTQTPNLSEFQNAAGTIQSKVDAKGSLRTLESARVAPWIEPLVVCTTAQPVGDTMPVAIPGATVTFTPKSDCRIQVTAFFDVKQTTAGPDVFVGELRVNGTSQSGTALFGPASATDRATVGQVWNLALTGGTSYTLNLYAYMATDNTFTAYNVAATHTRFSIIGLGRF